MNKIKGFTLFLLLNCLTSTAFAQTSIASKEVDISGGTLTVVAYIVLWCLVLGAVLSTLLGQRKLQTELDDLRKRMDVVLDVDANHE